MDIKTFNDINIFIQNKFNNLNPEKDTNNNKNDINDKFNKLDINTEVSKIINNTKRNFLDHAQSNSDISESNKHNLSSSEENIDEEFKKIFK